jgi:hypothetical protein
MIRVQKSQKTMEALNRASASNGKGLDKATLDSALDRLIETMDGVNRELDDLLAKGQEIDALSPHLWNGPGSQGSAFRLSLFLSSAVHRAAPALSRISLSSQSPIDMVIIRMLTRYRRARILGAT